jgi:aryl-alcohol dehydrogenase-like predicted oxidoreductase
MARVPTGPLGRTGIHVSRIGLGTVKFGRTQGLKYPRATTLPSNQEIRDLLNLALSRGINLLDTAPAYGVSEERIGDLLPGRREEWVLITKCGEEFADGNSTFDFTPRHFRYSLLRSLERLKTDYVDVLLVHSNGDDEGIIRNFEVFDTLDGFRKEGLVRAIGFSPKTLRGTQEAMKRSDVLMVTLNPRKPEMIRIIQEATKKGVGVLTKHTLNSGRLDELQSSNPIERCLNLALRECAAASALVGTSDLAHLGEITDTTIDILGKRENVQPLVEQTWL